MRHKNSCSHNEYKEMAPLNDLSWASRTRKKHYYCGYCGKEIDAALYLFMQYSYKIYVGSKKLYFCSYTCQCKYEREKK